MQTSILFVTLIFVAIGTSSGGRWTRPPMQSGSKASVNTVPQSLASSTNGSSLEEILNELNTRTQIQSGCHFSAGTYGGGGGGSFNELPDNCGALIKTIRIRSGSRVDAIQITYIYANGEEHTGNKYGGNGGGLTTINLNVDAGERVIGVFGRSGSAVDQLGFLTSFGRVLGPYGGGGGGAFTVNSCQLRGIFGRSGSRIDAIGFHCSNLF